MDEKRTDDKIPGANIENRAAVDIIPSNLTPGKMVTGFQCAANCPPDFHCRRPAVHGGAAPKQQQQQQQQLSVVAKVHHRSYVDEYPNLHHPRGEEYPNRPRTGSGDPPSFIDNMKGLAFLIFGLLMIVVFVCGLIVGIHRLVCNCEAGYGNASRGILPRYKNVLLIAQNKHKHKHI